MKICLVYLRIVKKSDSSYPVVRNYEDSTRRFLESYKAFKPPVLPEFLVVNCGGYQPDDLFDGVADEQVTAVGGGYDCGTYQEINRLLCYYDLVLALNTHCYFWTPGWLDLFVRAAHKHGPGVYGASASFEFNPHLRTPCLAYHPGVLDLYPLKCQSRGDACAFEHGKDNFSLWAHAQGFPSMLVASDGNAYPLGQWRTPLNIFRRGDQSNVPVWDRHIDVFASATSEEQAKIAAAADGLPAKPPLPALAGRRP